MKKLFLTFIFCAICIVPVLKVQAQSSEIIINSDEGSPLVTITKDVEETKNFSLSVSGLEIGFGAKESQSTNECGKKRHRRRGYKGYIGLLEFGFNGLASTNYKLYPDDQKEFMDLRNGKSVFVNWNVLKVSTALNKTGSIGFSSALGLTWRDYAFEEKITLVKYDGMIHPEAIDPSYKKSKLSTFSLSIPVLLEFNVNRFFLSAGVYGDLVVGSHTKYKKPKHKDKNGHYVNVFNAGATARIGYRNLYAFGNYSFTSLFKKDKGPEAYPYTIGIGLKLHTCRK